MGSTPTTTDNAPMRLLRAVRYLPIYVACVAPAALLWHQPAVLTFVYAVTSVLLLAWRHSTTDLIYFFVPFLLGPAGEIFAVRGGAWVYSDQTTTLPLWLPFVWGIAGLFMKNVSAALAGSDLETMNERDTKRFSSDEFFRKLVTRVIVLGVASWVIFLLAFMGYHLIVSQPQPEGWLLVLIHEHYAALIQVPVLALGAFFGVVLFGVVSGQQIEFKVWGVEFRGAAGPVVLSIFSFLALVLATYCLWDLG